MFAVWIALQSVYQKRVALRWLPSSPFLFPDLYFSSFAHCKAEFDCFGFAGRCHLRPNVHLLGWYQTCDNTEACSQGYFQSYWSFLFWEFMVLQPAVRKEEQGSGLVVDWGRQKPPVPFGPEIQKAPGSLSFLQPTSQHCLAAGTSLWGPWGPYLSAHPSSWGCLCRAQFPCRKAGRKQINKLCSNY